MFYKTFDARFGSHTPTPGVEPGLCPRQGHVIAVRPRRHISFYRNLFLKITIAIKLKYVINIIWKN